MLRSLNDLSIKTLSRFNVELTLKVFSDLTRRLPKTMPYVSCPEPIQTFIANPDPTIRKYENTNFSKPSISV